FEILSQISNPKHDSEGLWLNAKKYHERRIDPLAIFIPYARLKCVSCAFARRANERGFQCSVLENTLHALFAIVFQYDTPTFLARDSLLRLFSLGHRQPRTSYWVSVEPFASPFRS